MERKTGEIFKYNGEWYQCVEGTGCYKCCFNFNEDTCTAENPHCTCRTDHKNVVFKKLEKVGEPYSDYCPSGRIIYFQRYKCYQKPIYTGNFICWADDINISIEIKQNQEDMEEKYSELTDIIHEYMDKDMTYKDFKEAINYWVDDYNKLNKETDKLTLKPFDLKAAKAGKPVCTRDGRKARIICFDKEGNFPLVVLVKDEANHLEEIKSYSIQGVTDVFRKRHPRESEDDLMMLPEKHEGWVNVYRYSTPIYDSEEKAMSCIGSEKRNEYITTVKIE